MQSAFSPPSLSGSWGADQRGRSRPLDELTTPWDRSRSSCKSPQTPQDFRLQLLGLHARLTAPAQSKIINHLPLNKQPFQRSNTPHNHPNPFQTLNTSPHPPPTSLLTHKLPFLLSYTPTGQWGDRASGRKRSIDVIAVASAQNEATQIPAPRSVR